MTLNVTSLTKRFINIVTKKEEEEPSDSENDDPNSTHGETFNYSTTPEEGFKELEVS